MASDYGVAELFLFNASVPNNSGVKFDDSPKQQLYNATGATKTYTFEKNDPLIRCLKFTIIAGNPTLHFLCR